MAWAVLVSYSIKEMNMKTRIFPSLAFLILIASMTFLIGSSTANSKRTADQLNAAIKSEFNTAHHCEMYAKKAEAEGYSQEAKLFLATARAEYIHRHALLTAARAAGIEPEEPQMEATTVRSTAENLKALASLQTAQ